MENKLKIFPIFTAQSGCDYHRVRLPFEYGGQYWDSENVSRCHVDNHFENFGKVDLVVINRLYQGGFTRLANLKKKHGFKLVVDLDDWWVLPEKHPLHKMYKERTAAQIIKCMELADMCTVTTERLKEKVLQHNENVHVLPNALPIGHDQFKRRRPRTYDSKYFNFVYAAQSSHLQDVNLIRNVLIRSKKLNQKTQPSFTLAGWQPNKIWYDMEKVFRKATVYCRIPLMPLNEYMNVYDNADCSIVPLVNNDFNRHKSNLKLIEAACKGIPVIYSKVPPYSDCDAPIEGVSSDTGWFNSIEKLLCIHASNPNIIHQMGEDMFEWGLKNHNLFEWNKVRFELYKNLIHG